MSWAQLRQFSAAGHEIGGHTVNHAPLTDIDEATARAEIQGDITTLQAQGFPRPVSFAYPYRLPRAGRAAVRQGSGVRLRPDHRHLQEGVHPTGERVRVADTPREPRRLRGPGGAEEGRHRRRGSSRQDPPRLPDARRSTPRSTRRSTSSLPGCNRVPPTEPSSRPSARYYRGLPRRGNQPPVAAAGPAQTVPGGSTVQLDGAGQLRRQRRPADLPVDPDGRHRRSPSPTTPRADPPSPHRAAPPP